MAVIVCASGVGTTQERRDPEAVVRDYAQALSDGKADGVVALFTPDAVVFDLPADPDRLTGSPSTTLGTQAQRTAFYRQALALSPRARVQGIDSVAVGDLVAATMQVTGRGQTVSTFSLFRIRDGRIADLWELARSAAPSAAGDGREAIRRFVAANNAGSIEPFLAAFSPAAKFLRGSDDPHGLADKMSEGMSTPEGRRSAIVAAFKNGSPGQADIVDILAFEDFVVSHDRVTLPAGRVMNQMKIYRVRGGLITHDWTAYEQ